jgi:hypothetical protein
MKVASLLHAAPALAMAGLLAALGAAAAPAPEPPKADAVTLSVSRETPDAPVYAGEPLALRITLRNPTAGPLMVPNWEHFADQVSVQVAVTGYPGESGNAGQPPATWDGGPFQKGDFRALAPGETVITRDPVPLLPGKARITVGFHGPSDTYLSLTDGKKVRLQNAWTGHLYATLTLDVSADISPQMKQRYDDVRRQLADPLVPGEQKGRLLALVAEEKHYWAVRFLQEAAAGLPPGPMRDAAVLQLLKLAKLGTAYEAIPLLLASITDVNANQQMRLAILEWAVASLEEKGRMAIADQAAYTWPDALQKQARASIEAATKDRNPYFAARARDLLRRLSETPAPGALVVPAAPQP